MIQEPEVRRRGRAARERILTAAATLFERQGINPTGMEQVAAAAPVSKRTLYSHFPTKDDLVVGYLRHLEEAGLTLESILERQDLSPRDRLLALFSAPVEVSGPIRGCPFIDAAAEFPDPSSPVHGYASERKARLAQRLAELAREAGAVNADILGEQLAILSDGASSRAMVLNDARCTSYARIAAEALLDAATTVSAPA
ncbi:TetR family transcriptional regulator [Streptomyces sp. NPDC005708]|uniref:TetR/AcrR family transcriptional regulator n=1 Tax=unclassified Streptomyces TaxID=2593676 RepID=UPI0033F39F1D